MRPGTAARHTSATWDVGAGRWRAPFSRGWPFRPARGGWTWAAARARSSAAILADQSPLLVRGIDRSEEHVAHARRQIRDARASFGGGDAQDLPVASAAFDVAVSGLVLNFVPAPLRMVSEMRRAVRPGGRVAVYVWDYAGKAEFLRYFWDAAVALDPPALALDEGIRFPICRPEPWLRCSSRQGWRASKLEPSTFRRSSPALTTTGCPSSGGRDPRLATPCR